MDLSLGDGRARLLLGETLGVLRELPTASVDAVVTDPPYSSGGQYKGDRSASTGTKYSQAEKYVLADFSGDSRDQRSYAYWSALWMSEALRVTRPGGFVLAFTDWRQLPATTDAVQAGGWTWRGVVPWVKPHARPQLGRFRASAEYVVWGSAGGLPSYGAGEAPALEGWFKMRPPSSQAREHQTQKPVELMRELLRIVPEGGTVLDPFMGAGTTGVAALESGRRFVGVEMVPVHFETSERRISAALGSGVQESLEVVPGVG